MSSSGQPVYLYQGDGGVVIGSTATAEGDISAANTVFTIAVNAETGVLTVTQSQPVDHGDSDAYDGAYQDDLASFGANILELEGTSRRKRLEVRQPILTNEDLEKIRRIGDMDDNPFQSKTLDLTFFTERGAKGTSWPCLS